MTFEWSENFCTHFPKTFPKNFRFVEILSIYDSFQVYPKFNGKKFGFGYTLMTAVTCRGKLRICEFKTIMKKW